MVSFVEKSAGNVGPELHAKRAQRAFRSDRRGPFKSQSNAPIIAGVVQIGNPTSHNIA